MGSPTKLARTAIGGTSDDILARDDNASPCADISDDSSQSCANIVDIVNTPPDSLSTLVNNVGASAHASVHGNPLAERAQGQSLVLVLFSGPSDAKSSKMKRLQNFDCISEAYDLINGQCQN